MEFSVSDIVDMEAPLVVAVVVVVVVVEVQGAAGEIEAWAAEASEAGAAIAADGRVEQSGTLPATAPSPLAAESFFISFSCCCRNHLRQY